MNAPAFSGLQACGPAVNRLPAALRRTPVAARPTNHVVLLHASGSSARQWTQAASELEAHPARLRVHAIDLHGHGARLAWQGGSPLTLAHEAALVEPLLERLGGAHVVGHSYGAAVALKLACCRPALIRSVVAFEPVLLRLLHGDAALGAEARAVHATVDLMRRASAAGQPDAAARRFIDFWSGPGSWDTMAPDRQRSTAGRVPVLLQQFDALYGESMDALRLARLHVPTLLLSGARTVATARTLMQHVRAALPNARYEVLHDMGHMGPVTHAAAFNRRVADFLGAQVEHGEPAHEDDELPALPHAAVPERLSPDLSRTLFS